jgi:hypothetical protein
MTPATPERLRERRRDRLRVIADQSTAKQMADFQIKAMREVSDMLRLADRKSMLLNEMYGKP